MTTRRNAIAWFAIVLPFTAVPASAQTDFTSLNARPGDTVFVTRASGATIRGPLGAISPASITVNQETVAYEPGLKIAREGDRLLNGIIIGAAIGVGSGLTIAAEACLDTPLWHCAVGGAIGFGAFGALVDWLHKGRTTIFEAPRSGRPSVRLLPELGGDCRSLGLVVSF